MKQACLAAAVVVVMAFSPAVAQQTSPDDNHLIVPGQQIGPIKLGGTIEDALAALGRPLAATDRSVGTAVLIVWSSRPFPFWSRLGAWTTRECLDPPASARVNAEFWRPFSSRICSMLPRKVFPSMLLPKVFMWVCWSSRSGTFWENLRGSIEERRASRTRFYTPLGSNSG